MSTNAGPSPSRRSLARSVLMQKHRIPSANSTPYICVEGPDRNLWFCESGATPIGIALGADGHLWFAQKKANKIGRLTPCRVRHCNSQVLLFDAV